MNYDKIYHKLDDIQFSMWKTYKDIIQPSIRDPLKKPKIVEHILWDIIIQTRNAIRDKR